MDPLWSAAPPCQHDAGESASFQGNPEHVERLYALKLQEGLSSTTVHHLHTVLHHAFDDALRKGLVPRNITELVNVPRMRSHETQALTREQARVLLRAAHGERLEALIVLALATGMREGELLGLHWRDVDLDARTLQVRYSVHPTRAGFSFTEPKTKTSRRLIVLNGRTAEVLQAHRARQLTERMAVGPAWHDQDLVFTTPAGEPLAAWNMVRGVFYPLLQRAGLPRIRFHDLRHTAATLLLLQGVLAKVTSAMLGHATTAVTQDVYRHVQPSMQQEAAAAMEAVLWGPEGVVGDACRNRSHRLSRCLVRLRRQARLSAGRPINNQVALPPIS